METRSYLVVALLMPLSLVACSSQVEETPAACEEVIVDTYALDDPTPLGMSAREAFSPAFGMHRFSIKAPDEAQHRVKYRPRSLDGLGDVSLMYEGGEIRFVRSERVDDSDSHLCVDRLEADVRVSLNSDDGAFAESWVRTLVLDDPNELAELDPDQYEDWRRWLRIGFDVVPTAFFGSFEVVDANAPDGSSDIRFRPWLQLGFNDGELVESGLFATLSWNNGMRGFSTRADIYRFDPNLPIDAH